MSWYAATAYAAWVGARLPTEAEWEFGSRWRGQGESLTTGRYCAGDTEADLTRVGWYGGNSGGRPQPVKQKADCGGLYDMHGNAWEWVADWYGAYPAANGAADALGRLIAAIDGRFAPLPGPSGPPTGDVRVVRGGSFDDDADVARSAQRSVGGPRDRDDWVGFRLARPALSLGFAP